MSEIRNLIRRPAFVASQGLQALAPRAACPVGIGVRGADVLPGCTQQAVLIGSEERVAGRLWPFHLRSP